MPRAGSCLVRAERGSQVRCSWRGHVAFRASNVFAYRGIAPAAFENSGSGSSHSTGQGTVTRHGCGYSIFNAADDTVGKRGIGDRQALLRGRAREVVRCVVHWRGACAGDPESSLGPTRDNIVRTDGRLIAERRSRHETSGARNAGGTHEVSRLDPPY